MEVSGELHASAALLPGEEPSSTHWIGCRVGPRAGLDELCLIKRRILFYMWCLAKHRAT